MSRDEAEKGASVPQDSPEQADPTQETPATEDAAPADVSGSEPGVTSDTPKGLAPRVAAMLAAALGRLDDREDPPEVAPALMPGPPPDAPEDSGPPVVLCDMGLRITQTGRVRTIQVFDGDGRQLPAQTIVGLLHACADTVALTEGFHPNLRNAARRIGVTLADLQRLANAQAMQALCNGHTPQCAIRKWAATPQVNGSATPPPDCDCGFLKAEPQGLVS